MIKSVLGFVNGSVSRLEETNRTIFLSDNTHWNQKLFHQNCRIVKALIYHSADNDEIVKLFRNEVSKRTLLHVQKCEDKLRKVCDPIEVCAKSNIVIHFGKYKGNSLKYIYAINPSYISWLLTLPGFDLERTLQDNKVRVPMTPRPAEQAPAQSFALSFDEEDLPF